MLPIQLSEAPFLAPCYSVVKNVKRRINGLHASTSFCANYSNDVDALLVIEPIKRGMDLLQWSSKQGAILTGEGALLRLSQPGEDYDESDLPHYHLRQRNTRQTFAAWLEGNRRSLAVVGCWSRPLFAGGWQEDSDRETEAYNLQTPSIFVDMRFPLQRPTELLRSAGCTSTAQCSPEQLRLLARQHCFAGYSLPGEAHPRTFTRHHIIDWNYHPSFPRPRPNRWFVQCSPDGASFKEHSTVRDEDGVPVYFERWQRRTGDAGGEKYLAMRRDSECPAVAERKGRAPSRDAVLVVVGGHFAMAVNRAVFPTFAGCPGPAGPPLVDQALELGTALGRAEAAEYLDLEGSYGTVAGGTFDVLRSTHPWREGQALFPGAATVSVKLDAAGFARAVHCGADHWIVLENSFSVAELRGMFGPRYRARL